MSLLVCGMVFQQVKQVGCNSLKLKQIQSVDLFFNLLISLKSSEINKLI